MWRRLRQVARALLLLSLIAFVLPPMQVLTARFVDPRVTPTMIGQVIPALAAGAPVEWGPRWMPLDALGHVPLMAVSAEDQAFYLHSGFDDQQICAAVEDWRRGKRLRGASTITQQVARNLFLWHGGGFARKGLEAVYTAWIELLVPKDRILEIYLNIAETGPTLYGFEAAAQRWFGRPAAALTYEQAARLVTLLPAPTSRDPRDADAGKRARWILRNPAPTPTRGGFAHHQTVWDERARRLPHCLF